MEVESPVERPTTLERPRNHKLTFFFLVHIRVEAQTLRNRGRSVLNQNCGSSIGQFGLETLQSPRPKALNNPNDREQE